MSSYEVNLIAAKTRKDPAFRERMKGEPEKVAAEFRLTPRERDALLAGDVAGLYRLGAHEYLLMGFAVCGVLGLDVPTYSERIRSTEPRLVY